MSARSDWTNYLRVHSDRRNLLIHAIAVPLFAAAVIVCLASLARGAYVSAVIAVGLAVVSMALQRKGHGFEAHPPEPFTGPGNFLKRWFTEQFVTFPLFVVTGRWWRQFKADSGGTGSAA